MAITDDLCRSFLDLWWHFDPVAATWAGREEHDGRLGSFDPESIRLHLAALRSIAGALEELDVEETADEIDRTALLDHLRVLLFRFEHEHPYRRNPALWVEHASEAFGGLLARPVDAGAALAALDRLRALPRFFADARGSLRRPPLFLVDTALAQLDGLSALLAELSGRFAGAWAAADDLGPLVLTDAVAAVERFGLALRAEIEADSEPGSATIGEEEVDRRLHYEHASIHNAAEVWRASLRLATEVEQEVIAAAASIDPGLPWRDVYRRTRDFGPSSDSGSALRAALEEAGRFAESRGLLAGVTAPLDIVPASPVVRLTEPIACYRPGAGGIRAAIEIGDPDPAAVPWLAAGLGFPGLHVHRARSDTLPGLVRRHIAATSTPFGWSLYAEELMAELGYAPDPESRLAERVLFLRDVHLAVADLGLHTRQLTTVDAIGHLTTRLPLDQATALADVRRLACHPLSACAAILGRGEVRRLRDDLRAARGAAFDAPAFHEALFGYGGLPVPLIRWGMGLDG